MFEQLEKIINQYEYLTNKISEPDALSNIQAYTQYTQELSEIQEIADKYYYYKSRKEYLDSLESNLEQSDDAEFKELIEIEIKEIKNELEQLEAELKELLIPDEEFAGKNIIVEIRAGVGGDEACIFANDIFNIITRYCTRNIWNFTIDDISENGDFGIKSVCLTISGKLAYSKLKYFNGVIRVQRVPETEAKGRLHTSTASIFVYPERDVTEVNINPADIEMEVCRSSGAGGQHINKTSSCVMLTHIPTGIVVRSQAQRSQLQNRETCMKMLASKLFDYYNKPKEADFVADKNNVIGNTERSQKILTFNYPRAEVIDHRTGVSANLDKVLSGDLDKLVEALQIADQK